jgi:hypothetical protein
LRYLVGVPLVAVLYFPLYIGLFGLAFALGTSRDADPVFCVSIGILVWILGFPLMNLLYLAQPLRIVVPNEAIYILPAINAVLWGFFVTWLLGKLWRRRAPAAKA